MNPYITDEAAAPTPPRPAPAPRPITLDDIETHIERMEELAERYRTAAAELYAERDLRASKQAADE